MEKANEEIVKLLRTIAQRLKAIESTASETYALFEKSHEKNQEAMADIKSAIDGLPIMIDAMRD